MNGNLIRETLRPTGPGGLDRKSLSLAPFLMVITAFDIFAASVAIFVSFLRPCRNGGVVHGERRRRNSAPETMDERR